MGRQEKTKKGGAVMATQVVPTKRRLAITDGPPKFDLMLALFAGKEVYLTVEELGRIRVSLASLSLPTGVPAEDRRECWHFKGLDIGGDDHMPALCHIGIDGYFNSRTREGWIEVNPDYYHYRLR